MTSVFEIFKLNMKAQSQKLKMSKTKFIITGIALLAFQFSIVKSINWQTGN